MTHFGRTITYIATSAAVVLTTAAAVQAVPVVPNFTHRNDDAYHTETTSKITETINSMDYATGYQYSATGTGITANEKSVPRDRIKQCNY